jgi:hypothetical protein
MDGQVREMFQVDLGLDDEEATTRARGTEGGNEADEQSSAEQRRAEHLHSLTGIRRKSDVDQGHEPWAMAV